MVTIGQIQQWCNGTFVSQHNDVVIEDLSIDSRKVEQPEVSLFIAIKTKLRDGHTFIASAYEKGVRSFLISETIDTSAFPSSNFIQVKDTLEALHKIVIAYRKQFQIPVIGITGSNGKTVVKEWLYQLLSERYNVIRSPKSYNSQVGVPLSVWLLHKEHDIAIFEAGISQPGEMEKLGKMIQPTIGIFTNIGEAHNEGFLNLRQKIKEKLLLFADAKSLVFCSDYPELNECVEEYTYKANKVRGNSLELFSWSQTHEADLRVLDLQKEGNKTHIKALWKEEEIHFSIPFTDPASIENAIHCCCVMLLLGADSKMIQKGMQALHPVSMRMELREGINDCTIINDSYNSDLRSFHIALDYLEQQKQHKLHTVILSDMLQTGIPDAELYEEVAESVSRRNIHRFIGIGPALNKSKAAFKKNKKLRSIFFKSTDEFLKNFHLISFDNEAILLKGARVFTFEKIDMLLEQKVHQTILSINLSALTHNLNAFRSKLAPGVKTMAMVKAFAYGSGTYEIAGLLQYSGVDYLAVAYTDEGIELRKAGISIPIMVMSPDSISFDRMIAWKLEPEIFNFRSLQLFTDMAQTLQVQHYSVHIKLDTGMHRLGFMQHEMEDLAKLIADNPHIKVASIFSHLAASEDRQMDKFTQEQGGGYLKQ